MMAPASSNPSSQALLQFFNREWTDLPSLQKRGREEMRLSNNEMLITCMERALNELKGSHGSLCQQVLNNLIRLTANDSNLTTRISEIGRKHGLMPQELNFEKMLRVLYLKRYAKVYLANSDESFPIQDLFTTLVLVDYAEQRKKEVEQAKKEWNVEIDPELPIRDSLQECLESLQRTKSPLALEKIFDDKPQEGKLSLLRTVLLLGGAAFGKSTVCQQIVFNWASEKLWNQRYKAIYWIPLRQCNAAIESGHIPYEGNSEKWLAKVIRQCILLEEHLNEEALEKEMLANGNNTLILFDGGDEASFKLLQMIKEVIQHSKCSFLLTSRAGVTESFHGSMDRIIENIGFSDEQIDQYVERLILRNKKDKSPNQEVFQKEKTTFLSALRALPSVFGLAHNPLHLQLLYLTWKQGAAEVGFPSTLTELYRHIVNELFRTQCRKEGKDPDDIHIREREDLFHCLGEIGLTGLKKGRLMLSQKDIEDVLENFPVKIILKHLLGTGLLKATGEGVAREYYFLHLTFEEYLIAKAVARHEPERQHRFIIEHRYQPPFKLVLSFLAGILATEKGRAKTFFTSLHSLGADMTGDFQCELALSCLNECSHKMVREEFHVTYHLRNALVDLVNRYIFMQVITVSHEIYGFRTGYKKTGGSMDIYDLFPWILQLLKRFPLARIEILEAITQNLQQILKDTDHKMPIFSSYSAEIHYGLIQCYAAHVLNALNSLQTFKSQDVQETVLNILRALENSYEVYCKGDDTNLASHFMTIRQNATNALCEIGKKVSLEDSSDVMRQCIQIYRGVENSQGIRRRLKNGGEIGRMKSALIEVLGEISNKMPQNTLEEMVNFLFPLLENTSEARSANKDILKAFSQVVQGSLSSQTQHRITEWFLKSVIIANSNYQHEEFKSSLHDLREISIFDVFQQTLDKEPSQSIINVIKQLVQAINQTGKAHPKLSKMMQEITKKISKKDLPKILELFIDSLITTEEEAVACFYLSLLQTHVQEISSPDIDRIFKDFFNNLNVYLDSSIVEIFIGFLKQLPEQRIVEFISHLFSKFKKEKMEGSAYAFYELGRIGKLLSEPSVAQLLPVLISAVQEGRFTSELALIILGQKPFIKRAEVLAATLQAFESPDVNVRNMALHSLLVIMEDHSINIQPIIPSLIHQTIQSLTTVNQQNLSKSFELDEILNHVRNSAYSFTVNTELVNLLLQHVEQRGVLNLELISFLGNIGKMIDPVALPRVLMTLIKASEKEIYKEKWNEPIYAKPSLNSILEQCVDHKTAIIQDLMKILRGKKQEDRLYAAKAFCAWGVIIPEDCLANIPLLVVAALGIEETNQPFSSTYIDAIVQRLIQALQEPSGQEMDLLKALGVAGPLSLKYTPQIPALLLEILKSERRSHFAAVQVLARFKNIPEELLIPVVKRLIFLLKNRNMELRTSIINTLQNMRKKIPSDLVLELDKAISGALENPAVNTPSPEYDDDSDRQGEEDDDEFYLRWIEQVNHLKQTITDALNLDPVSEARPDVERARILQLKNLGFNSFRSIPFIKCLTYFSEVSVDNVFKLATERRIPLFIQLFTGSLHLCTLENNRLIHHPITVKQWQEIQAWYKTQAPMHAYVSTYGREFSSP